MTKSLFNVKITRSSRRHTFSKNLRQTKLSQLDCPKLVIITLDDFDFTILETLFVVVCALNIDEIAKCSLSLSLSLSLSGYILTISTIHKCIVHKVMTCMSLTSDPDTLYVLELIAMLLKQ